MGNLKRRVARVQVKLRKRQRDKEEKEIRRLQEQRNKALKSANRSLAVAKAREDAKDAKLKKSQAQARLNATKNQRGKVLLSQATSRGKSLLKDLRGAIEQKPARRKKRTTKNPRRG